ncbi:c-type cytochrome [Vibrio fluvialis]|nr:cytochrome c [Vibrio fluvialis]MCG6349046.1 c-type cytochrome [Vibrio fluvialis]MCG6380934.1 c-type cytochrome [Vibrio fluvialis]BEI23015.1 hypothetical protein KKIDH5335_13470 [Vibrio fluvialis]
MNKRAVSLLFALVALGTHYPVSAESGQDKFVTNCSGCHGMDAKGIIGLAPSLENPELWNRLGDKRDQYIAGVVTGGMSGKIESLGNSYQGFAMPPQSFLETADLVEITHYILSDINHLTGGPDASLIDKYKENPLSHQELHQLRNGD